MCAALRKSGNSPRAAILAKETLSFDPLDLGARFELAFAEGSEYPAKEQIEEITGGRPSSLLELAGSYLEAGFAGEALKVLSFCGNLALPHIYMAFALDMNGDGKAAADELEKAESAPPDLVFPGKDREIEILSFSVSRYREGALAPYYLGCLYYGRGNHNAAIPLWEEAVRRKPDYYHALRCLGIAYYEIGNDPVSSLQAMEKAFRLCKKPRYFLELLQLYKVCRKSVAERLETAEKNTQLLEMRDDLYKEYITLLNLNGRYAEAIQKLKSHIFHPYEGGEGILIREHVLSYIALGLKELAGGNFGAAVKYLKDALRYPENYGEGRKYNAHEAHIHYHLGLAYEKSGDMAAAKEWYLKAAGEEDDGEEPGICKSMALRKLGYVFEGLKVCENMLAMAERKLENLDEVPYMGLFPTGLPFEQSYKRLNHISALTAKMYGVIGMGRKEEARLVRGELDKITDISPWVNIINSDMEEFENG
jgi:tetratricopeptide (TPR) repeat protein